MLSCCILGVGLWGGGCYPLSEGAGGSRQLAVIRPRFSMLGCLTLPREKQERVRLVLHPATEIGLQMTV